MFEDMDIFKQSLFGSGLSDSNPNNDALTAQLSDGADIFDSTSSSALRAVNAENSAQRWMRESENFIKTSSDAFSPIDGGERLFPIRDDYETPYSSDTGSLFGSRQRQRQRQPSESSGENEMSYWNSRGMGDVLDWANQTGGTMLDRSGSHPIGGTMLDYTGSAPAGGTMLDRPATNRAAGAYHQISSHWNTYALRQSTGLTRGDYFNVFHRINGHATPYKP